MARAPRKGFFTPANPSKYVGDIQNIVYRSGLELECMKIFDTNSSVVNWTSEELVIPYVSPIDKKAHRYFVDFVIKAKQQDGTTQNYAVEIKPEKQCKPPRNIKNKARLLEEAMTYEVNQAKWNAAKAFCKKYGWKFVVWTEKNLGMDKKYKNKYGR